MPPSSQQPQPSTEKVLDWVFKITTALVIPTLIWSLKMSNQIVELRGSLDKQGAVHQAEIKHLNERVQTLEGYVSEVTKLTASVAKGETRIDGVDSKLVSVQNSMGRINDLLIELLRSKK